MTTPRTINDSDFAHLHLHTDRSFLDGVGRSVEYAELAKRHGHRSLAVTDHGNLYGLPEHRRACRDAGIRPIFGCELYVNDQRAEPPVERRSKEDPQYDPTFSDAHLVLLAATPAGFRNLLAINHDSVLNGFHYKPRTDHDFVCRHADGLIATTACLGSHFAQHAVRGNLAALDALLAKYVDAFTPERFFVELHVNEIPAQQAVNATLADRARRFGLGTVLAVDTHYACAGDAERQDEMIACARRTPLDSPDAFRLNARRLYYATPSQIAEDARRFGSGVDAETLRASMRRTLDVAERCDADIYPTSGGLLPPPYADPQRADVPPDAILRRIAVEGFAARVRSGDIPRDKVAVYRDRLAHELRVIARCGMADFYLVTMDLVQFCRRSSIVCWTRGSGCASLVAACVGITTLDPIRFDLLFERFVDPARPNAPDFDLDIEAHRRDEVVAYLFERYGGPDRDRVARICALHTFGLRSALRDVAQARGVPKAEMFRLAEIESNLDPSVEKSLARCGVADREATLDAAEAALRAAATAAQTELLDKHPAVVRSALTMVGRVRGRGMHAAGFVVAPGPLREYLPIDRGAGKESDIISAWGEGQASQDISETGLMKIDLLPSDVAAVVGEVVRETGVGLDQIAGWQTDFADDAVLDEFRSGLGVGLHQFAQLDGTAAALIRRLNPAHVEDIIAATALYRPGAMDHIDDFVSRARGETHAPSVHPIYDAITARTYGILVYQEQVMQVLNRLGGIELREAYAIIKAISKKKDRVIADARARFVAGATTAHGLPEPAAARIFDDVQKFAGYGFNRAHAASYGVLSWITAAQRARFPAQFWRAWLNRVENAAGKDGGERRLAHYMRAASRSVLLLPPSVDHSTDRWIVAPPVNGRPAVRAPLSIALGVGDDAARAIAAARGRWASGTPVARLIAFLAWCESDRRTVNHKAVVALAKGGALDCLAPAHIAVAVAERLGEHPASQRDKLSRVRAVAADLRRDRASVLVYKPDDHTRSAWESAAHGFAFWFSPWAIEGRAAKAAALEAAGRVAPAADRSSRGKRRALLLVAVRPHTDKKGRRMAFLLFQTRTGDPVSAVAFGSTWAKAHAAAVPGRVYLVAGEYDRQGKYLIGGPQRPVIDLDAVPVAPDQ